MRFWEAKTFQNLHFGKQKLSKICISEDKNFPKFAFRKQKTYIFASKYERYGFFKNTIGPKRRINGY